MTSNQEQNGRKLSSWLGVVFVAITMLVAGGIAYGTLKGDVHANTTLAIVLERKCEKLEMRWIEIIERLASIEAKLDNINKGGN